MARIRSIHPSQWTDGNFVCMSPLARLLAIALRNEADDNGVFPWQPVNIKLRLLPMDSCNIVELLEEIEAGKILDRYTVDDNEFAIIRAFQRYQSPRKPRFQYPVPAQLPKGFSLHPDFKGCEYDGTVLVPNRYGTGTVLVPHRYGMERDKERERERDREKEKDTSSGLVSAESQQAELPATASPVVMTFPCEGPKKSWDLREDKLREYEQTFSKLDVKLELHNALQWLRDNPSRQKTHVGMTRYLGNWLSKAQNSRNTASRKPDPKKAGGTPYL